jgi:hypothetical protein
MKQSLLFVTAFFVLLGINAQKIVENPSYLSGNINGKITKIELTDKETIFHFAVRRTGGWFSIPKETYIEDSSTGERLYVVKAEGIKLNEKNQMSPAIEKKFKLFFPPLEKDVKHINYGEANKGGNWFIYKLDVTESRDEEVVEEIRVQEYFNLLNQRDKPRVVVGTPAKVNFAANFNITGVETLQPEDLPKAFFGNWYDKYGTLMLIATPEYMILANSVSYYYNIHKDANGNYIIQDNAGSTMHILKLDDNTMSMRDNRLHLYHKQPTETKISKTFKGTWKNGNDTVVISDGEMSFEGSKGHYLFGSKKIKIVHSASSKNGDMHWFIVYSDGRHYIYTAEKINGTFELRSRSGHQKRYRKLD